MTPAWKVRRVVGWIVVLLFSALCWYYALRWIF